MKCCVRDTKNLTKFSLKKTRAKELEIFPLTYSFTRNILINLQASIFVKKVLSRFYLLSGTFAGSSRLNVFYEHGLLAKFANFTGKDLGQSLFLNKVAWQRLETLFAKETPSQMFPCNFCEVDLQFPGQLQVLQVLQVGCIHRKCSHMGVL